MSTLPARVGVIGGGRMGSGIAHAFLIAGCDVLVVEADPGARDAARERIERAVQASIERGTTDIALDDALQSLRVELQLDFLGDRGLVVEAVPESLDIKVPTLQHAERVIPGDAVLASNTSSLSITGLQDRLRRPSQFLGLHFFNPVPASTLIEVVVGAQTSDAVRDAAPDWVRALGKTPVVVNDAPGFASSRLGVALALEAMRMVEEGVASAEDIDAAMELGYKHPAGPLRTTDLVGLDVRLGIAEYLHSTLGERFAPPRILRDKVAAGELGRKTGRGFYDWTE